MKVKLNSRTITFYQVLFPLAWLPDYLNSEGVFRDSTPNSITNVGQLRRELEKVREKGWAYSDEEFAEGVRAIAGPVSGASAPGVHPPDEYWERIRTICDKYGVLLIVDEVMSGMGRTGTWWGIDHSSVERLGTGIRIKRDRSYQGPAGNRPGQTGIEERISGTGDLSWYSSFKRGSWR